MCRRFGEHCEDNYPLRYYEYIKLFIPSQTCLKGKPTFNPICNLTVVNSLCDTCLQSVAQDFPSSQKAEVFFWWKSWCSLWSGVPFRNESHPLSPNSTSPPKSEPQVKRPDSRRNPAITLITLCPAADLCLSRLTLLCRSNRIPFPLQIDAIGTKP